MVRYHRTDHEHGREQALGLDHVGDEEGGGFRVSYAGAGTVQPNWQQAQNLISQQTQIIISELVQANQKVTSAESARAHAERKLKEYQEKPIAYTEGWYVKELGKERERRYRVESDLRRAQGFMKMKDQAKIKVERTRDWALREVSRLTELNEEYLSQALKADDFERMNARHVEAFAGHERMLAAKESEVRRLREENARLMEVIRLGREGLQREQW